MGADDKSNLKKCGEILINLNKKNKKSKTYTFHCTFCETSWDQMKKFSMHLEESHFQNFEEETNDLPMIYEPEIKIETPIDSKLPEIENKILVNDIKDDPLEMKVASLENPEFGDVEIKDENDVKLDIKTEDIDDNDSDDNDDDYKPFKVLGNCRDMKSFCYSL